MMKHIKLLGVILLCITFHDAFAAKKNNEPLDGIVAIVNDMVVTQSELSHEMTTVKKQMAASNVATPDHDTLRKQVLDQLINKKLQMFLAEQGGIHIADSDVTKAIENIAKNNKLTVSELYERLTTQGFSVSDYRKEIHDQMVLQTVQQRSIGSKITISPEEIKDFARTNAGQVFNNKEYHLEDVLIALPDSASPNDVAKAKARAEKLMATIHHGTSFHDATKADANDPNALQGGDLGWRKLPEIPSAFATELVHMKKNDIAGPIQAPNGFHVIHLAEIRDVAGTRLSAAQQHNQMQQLLYQKKFDEALKNWITKIRSEAFINTNPKG